jgi:hypothetical protein
MQEQFSLSLSPAEAMQIARNNQKAMGFLTIATQDYIAARLIQNAEGQLSADATATLDRLLTQVDNLNILKTRAKYTLQQLYGVSA